MLYTHSRDSIKFYPRARLCWCLHYSGIYLFWLKFNRVNRAVRRFAKTRNNVFRSVNFPFAVYKAQKLKFPTHTHNLQVYNSAYLIRLSRCARNSKSSCTGQRHSRVEFIEPNSKWRIRLCVTFIFRPNTLSSWRNEMSFIILNRNFLPLKLIWVGHSPCSYRRETLHPRRLFYEVHFEYSIRFARNTTQ